MAKHLSLIICMAIFMLCCLEAKAQASLVAPVLTAVPVSEHRIDLSWTDNNKTKMGTIIERASGGSTDFEVLAKTAKNVKRFTDEGLASATTYCYRVRVFDRKGNLSPYSNVACATTLEAPEADTIPPATPLGLTASAASCSQIDLSWIPSTDTGGSGLNGYKLYRNGALLKFVPAPTTTTTDIGLGPSTTYSYQISAVDNAGNESAKSNVASATTPACPDTTPPSVPSGLSATATSFSQIDLSWNPSTDTGGSGLNGYRIYRNGVFLKSVLSPATSAADTGLSETTTYSYAVSAIDYAGNESARSTTVPVTTPACPDTTPPSVPSGLSATATNCSQIDLSWNPSTDTGGSGLNGYKVYRNGSFLKQVSAPATTLSDTGLTASTQYTYQVSAIDNAGNESARSVPCSAATTACPDTFPPTTPTGLTVIPLASNKMSLSWDPSVDTGGSGMAGYHVYRDGSHIGATADTTYLDEGLAPNSQYCYSVAAYDSAGNTSARTEERCGTTEALSSSGRLLWARHFGGTGNDIGKAVAVDRDGNILMLGQIIGTVDLGGGPVGSPDQGSLLLAKFSSTGTHLWSRAFGNPYGVIPQAIAVDSAGNVLVSGYFVGSVDLGGGVLTSAGLCDIFLAKYSTSGSHLWSKRFGASSDDAGYAVAVDSDGNVVLTGCFGGTVDFGGGPITSSATINLFVAKYTPEGTHLWSKKFLNNSANVGYGLAVDANNNILVTGYFMGKIDFGGGILTSAGLSDIFVVKLTSSGTYLWARRFGAARDDMGYAIAVDPTGNVAVTGSYGFYPVDLGGGPLTNAGMDDAFVAVYSADGSHVWSRGLGSSVVDRAYDIAMDSFGDVVVTGSFRSTVDFGGGPLASAGYDDIFVAKYLGTDGSHLWSKRFGSSSEDIGYGLAVAPSDKIAVTGIFNGTVDFGTGPLTSSGGRDMFLLQIAP